MEQRNALCAFRVSVNECVRVAGSVQDCARPSSTHRTHPAITQVLFHASCTYIRRHTHGGRRHESAHLPTRPRALRIPGSCWCRRWRCCCCACDGAAAGGGGGVFEVGWRHRRWPAAVSAATTSSDSGGLVKVGFDGDEPLAAHGARLSRRPAAAAAIVAVPSRCPPSSTYGGGGCQHLRSERPGWSMPPCRLLAACVAQGRCKAERASWRRMSERQC